MTDRSVVAQSKANTLQIGNSILELLVVGWYTRTRRPFTCACNLTQWCSGNGYALGPALDQHINFKNAIQMFFFPSAKYKAYIVRSPSNAILCMYCSTTNYTRRHDSSYLQKLFFFFTRLAVGLILATPTPALSFPVVLLLFFFFLQALDFFF